MSVQDLINRPPRQLLTIEELAEQLQVPVNTIYRWNSSGGGPVRRKVGRNVRYDQKDVDKWLDSRARG